MSFLVATEDVYLTYTDAMGTMTVAITAMKNAVGQHYINAIRVLL